MRAQEKLLARSRAIRSCLCIGIDPVFERLPSQFQEKDEPFFEFGKWIIEQTHEYAVAYKPNSAFFEARGAAGMHELHKLAEYLRSNHPDIFLIDDAKRGDIESTNDGYVTAIFDEMGFDAITVHPYLGRSALEPFLSRAEKMTIILCHTSNPGAAEVQDLAVGDTGQKLWEHIAAKVAREWNTHHNCMLVVGATYPAELKRARELVGEEMIFLVPGVGAQGGSLQEVLANGCNAAGEGVLVNASRSIVYAADPHAEAEKLVKEYRKYRKM